jgi:hypothetical protein
MDGHGPSREEIQPRFCTVQPVAEIQQINLRSPVFHANPNLIKCQVPLSPPPASNLNELPFWADKGVRPPQV